MSDKATGEHIAELKHYKSVAGRKGIVTEYVEAGSASAEFLYRMERRRIEQPCRVAVDMRGKVPGTCFAYEFQRMTHYLDEACRVIFDKTVAEFGGKYTVGVFEKVTSADHTFRAQELKEQNDRARRARQAQGKASAAERLALAPAQQALEPAHEVEVLPFGYSSKRKETRLTFITTVTLQLGARAHPAKTSDISLSGLKLTLAEPVPLSVGQSVGVHFTALAGSENFPHAPVPYRIVKIGEKSGKQLVFVQRRADQEQVEFDRFLTQFIDANQRRYKIDLEDAVLALKARVYGQLYAQVLGHVPFFLRGNDLIGASLAWYGASTCNGNVLRHPACGPGEFLARLLRPERLQELIRRSEREEHLLIFTYTAQRGGQPALFTAAEHEFATSRSRADFLARARASGSLRVFQARLKTVSEPDAARLEDIMAALDRRGGEPAASVRARFAELSYAGALFEVSEQFAHTTDTQVRSAHELAGLAAEEDVYLNPPGPVAKPHRIALGYRGKRSEARFLHKTDIELMAGGTRHNGFTVDFSTRGLKCLLTRPLKLPAREPVKVSLVSLSKRMKDNKLLEMPYLAVSGSEDGLTLSLVREERPGFHSGSEFFRKLIDANRDRLEEDVHEHILVAESLWAESLIGDNLLTLPFVVSRDGQYRHWLTRVGISEQADPLLWFFRDEAGEFDFSGVGSPTVLKPLLVAAHLINDRPKGALFSAEAYLFKDFDPRVGYEVTHAITSLQLKDEPRKALIAAAHDKFEHRFLRVQLMAAESFPDAEYDEELQFIRTNGRHRASQLHEEFHSVVAFGELLDVSALIAARELGASV